MIRAIRIELARPQPPDSWESFGPTMHALAKATPKLLDAAYDARIAIDVAGRDAVKERIAPDAKAQSAEGLSYQAVLRAVERLREWGAKKYRPFASLEVPGGMASAISRAAGQAYGRRDQGRVRFSSERVLVRAAETSIAKDDRGYVLSVALRSRGRVRFAVARSWGSHADTLAAIVRGEIEHGDCKLQYDERRKKWYGLLAYEAPDPVPMSVDPARVLAVHRGARNALYLLSSTGARGVSLPGSKLLAQRRALQARMRDAKRIGAFELGGGAKGHGRTRRMERYSQLEDKLARVTKTFCQQAAAFACESAKRLGCGMILIEDYGGIEPDEDSAIRRILDHGPLYALKQAIDHRCEKDGLTLREVPSAYLSTQCPRCLEIDPRSHNVRTGMFRCRVCVFERPADWVAAYWMLQAGGADMRVWRERLDRERELADKLRGEEHDQAAQ